MAERPRSVRHRLGADEQQRVTDAIAHREANTPLRFVRRTTANQGQFPDFVHFRSGSGCSSSVGRRGGQQFVNLGSGCTTGSTIHEIGHVIGLWHEQLCHKFWTASGGWSQWFGLGGICSGVAAVATGDKTDMYVRGQDGTLFPKWWDGRRHVPGPADHYWHGTGLRMQPRALSVIGWKGFRDVYALDQNGQLCHKFFA